MTGRQLVVSAAAATLGVATAIAGAAGQTDVAVGAIGLLLAGLLILVVDVRRRQGELARRLKRTAERQLHANRRLDRLQTLPRHVETATQRSLAALTDEFQVAAGRIEAAGEGTLSGIAQERLAAAERHLELTERVDRVIADLLGVSSGVASVHDGVSDTKDSVTDLRREVIASLDEASKANKRRQVTLREHIDKLGYEPVRQVQALLQLRDRVTARAPLPPTGGWAMEPTAILRLLHLVEQSRPALVVECGSGASTVWLAYALESIGQGQLVALEHDERYAEQTRRALDEHGLSHVAEVRTAPLSEIDLGEQAFTWYDPGAVQDLKDIELLLVDGPPRASGPRARYPAVPLLGPRLAPGARVVLDDVDRPEEQEAAEAWLAETPGLAREASGTDRSAVLVYRPA